MSGMEALAAFGLACNVMQAIHFALKTATMCKTAFKTGNANLPLTELVNDSAQVHESLRDSILSAQPLTRDEKEFLDIAEKTLVAATQLKREVTKVASPSSKGRLMASLGIVIKTKWRESKVDDLKKALEGYRHVLETRLLIRICDKNDALRLQQETSFTGLDRTLQSFIQASSQGQIRMEALFVAQGELFRSQTFNTQQAITAALSSESSKTRDDFATAMRDLGSGPPIWQRRERLLRSLKYSSSNDRFNQISETHEGTYQWVLQGIRPWLGDTEDHPSSDGLHSDSHLHSDCSPETAELNVSWNCFPCWLESPDEKIYWIQGKPGSGKSTLVKFLISESEGWPAPKLMDQHPLILWHFLWAAGVPIQRSIRGILLSLVHQFLSVNEQIIDDILKAFPQARLKDVHGDWSKPELEKVISTWFTKAGRPVLIFLDGLDEIETVDTNPIDTPANLIKLIRKLAGIDKIKLCVSSRPDPELRMYLSKIPTLELQALTRFDMKLYAEAHLLQYRPEEPEGEAEYRDLIETLCDKADGVFFWIALASRSLLRGVTNSDGIAELKQRALKMPDGLYSLYQDMWSRLNEDESMYREEAALYLNMALAWPSIAIGDSRITVFHIVAASDPSIATALLQDESAFSADEIEARCSAISKRIKTRTAGLLEIGRDGELVGFIHRSANEFFDNTPEGRRILSYDHTPFADLKVNLTRAYLAGVFLQVLHKRKTRAYLEKAHFPVISGIYRLWASESIPEPAGFDLLMACKKLYDTNLWRLPPVNASDRLKLTSDALDFYGRAAYMGLAKLVAAIPTDPRINTVGLRLSPSYRKYLFIAACSDPDTSHTLVWDEKSLCLAEVIDQSRFLDIEIACCRYKNTQNTIVGGAQSGENFTKTTPPMMFLAALNVHVGELSPARAGISGVPEIVSQYLDASFPLSEKITFGLRQLKSEANSNCWTMSIHGFSPADYQNRRQLFNWVAVETDVASLVDLHLSALVAAGPESESYQTVLAAQAALVYLRRKTKPSRRMKVVAFGLDIRSTESVSLLGSKDGKPVIPATQMDAEHILVTLRDHRVQLVTQGQGGADGESSSRKYEVVGLLGRLMDIAPRATEILEDDYEQAIDLPLRRQLVEFVSKPPEPFVD
ncbi:hypothetical protein B0H63DRAFT_485620 [Podospora didyma]|uniref:NACHT domain-containing protein n=1 Tax=Podospora didyma TaxID=330526 RepID=A0AAE0K566_9PEZI|nr:hypothetical protein B0H63DRAFT_485620 [Podospora didyma]